MSDSRITIEVPDVGKFSSTSPSSAVRWICANAEWLRRDSMIETKEAIAASAQTWSGETVSTQTAWRFLNDLANAGLISLDVRISNETNETNENHED